MGPFRIPALLVAGFLLSSVALGQEVSQTASLVHAPMDPQAVSLIQKTLGVLDGMTAVQDVTLTGTATRTVGPDSEIGSITLKALGPNQSRVDFVSVGGTWSEIRDVDAKKVPHGFSIKPDGTLHAQAGHNLLTNAVWFLPALSYLSQTSRAVLAVTYVGQETKAGVSVQHLHFFFQNQNPKVPPQVNAHMAFLSATEVYLDAATSLPVAITFNTHPDNNLLVSIPVEVDYSNYQPISGIQVPFRIQKLENGTPYYDITIQSAAVNSGLSATDFTAQ